MKTGPLRWLRRYLPAECAASLTAVASAQLVSLLTDSSAMATLAGAWGETCVYYVVMLAREVDAAGTRWLAVRNLVLEFGVAEALDSLLVRPSLMYLATQLIGDLSVGVLLGKATSDVIFYVPVIAAYELRRSRGGLRTERCGADILVAQRASSGPLDDHHHAA